MERKHYIDVTEIFRVLKGEKQYRMIKLALYFSMFMIVIYKSVSALHLTANILI